MRRLLVLTGLSGTLIAVFGLSGTALAGGGCHDGATQGDATGQDGVTVTMIEACFDASVTSVDPGTTVTFLNKDPLTHNVSATGWGHYDDLHQGDLFRSTFDEEGIYPFACTYHPGMTGAIVVGDGMGAGSGATVTTTLPKLDVADAQTVPVAAAEASSGAWIAAAAVLGLAVGAGAVFAVNRMRSAPRAS